MARKEWKQPWPVTDSPVQIPPEALGDSWQAFLFKNVQVLTLSSTKILHLHCCVSTLSSVTSLLRFVSRFSVYK